MPAKKLTNTQLDDLIQQLPGYDPVKTAEDCRFDHGAARQAIEFIEECCSFTQGERAGQPFILEPWQKALIANLFGWQRPDGSRRYREALLFVARGNGKSELAGAIVCYLLFMEEEPGAQLYSAAAKRDQAGFIFQPVTKMIRNCPEMIEQATIYKNSIVVGDRVYKTISREATTEHGGSTHFAVVDELHAQPDRDLVDVLYTSTIKRRNPLILYVTTSDFERPESICNEKHGYACKVRDGAVHDPAFLPAIFEAAIDDDWTDPEVWRKANPNLGVSIKQEDLAKLCRKAQDVPGFLNTFLRLHLNVRTQSDVRWLSLEHWDATDAELDPGDLEGRPCWGGLDLSTTTDLSALALVFPRDSAPGYDVLVRFWVPEENARRREERDRAPYSQWIRQGFITATPGDVIDYDRIRADVNGLRERFDIREVACDRWNASQLITQLAGDGLTIFPFGQGYQSMSPAAKELEKVIIGRQIAAGRNPVLRWMVSNVSIEEDAAGNIKPSKRKSTERIDGIVALTMAIGRASLRQAEDLDNEPQLIVL